MVQDGPGGRQKWVSTFHIWRRLRSFTGHGKLQMLLLTLNSCVVSVKAGLSTDNVTSAADSQVVAAVLVL